MREKPIYTNTVQEPPSTKLKLIEAGREEFFLKGYQQAGLRRICAACQVTTGAFYFFFPSKDALLCAVVDPFIHRWKVLADRIFIRELEDISTARENDRELMELLLFYRQEILILVEKAAGSSREHFKDEIYNRMIFYFTKTFSLAIGREPDQGIIRLLVNSRFHGIISILKGGCSMEQALLYSDVLASYASGGYERLIKDFKDVL